MDVDLIYKTLHKANSNRKENAKLIQILDSLEL